MQRIKWLCQRAGLSIEQTEILMLMHGEGRSREELAEDLDVSETTITQRRKSGIARLRKHCELHPEDSKEAEFFGLWESVRRRRAGTGRPKTHGASKTKAYWVWASMKQRCNNPNNKSYQHYGGRGIKVCARWNKSFKNFIADMGNPPDGMSLDRINNSLGYAPGNCKWSTPLEQSANRRPAVNPGRPRKVA